MEIWIFLKLQINLIQEKKITLSKPEKKISELWNFIKKEINQKNQILGLPINRVKFLDYASAKKI